MSNCSFDATKVNSITVTSLPGRSDIVQLHFLSIFENIFIWYD